MDKLHRICSRALSTFGYPLQLDKAAQECLELALELSKLREGRGNITDVCSEIADVTIMVTQLRMIYGDESIDRAIEYKLNRLQVRLDLFEADK